MDTPTILAGGRWLTVAFSDGHTEEIKVRQLPIRLLASMAARQADEAALVELYCSREEGWADTLTHQSHAAIVTTGDEINHSPFQAAEPTPHGNASRSNGKRQAGRAGQPRANPARPAQKGHTLTLDDVLGSLCARSLLPANAEALERSPHLVLWLYEHHSRQRAADALLSLRVTYAATAPGTLQNGGDAYREAEKNFERMSAATDPTPAQEEEGNVWPPRARTPNP